jgi:hypothetical protein
MKTIDNIEQYIKEKEQVTVNELVRYFGLSKQTIHKHLNNLLLDKKVTKVGTPPKVYYQFLEFKKEEKVSVNIPKQYKEVIEDNFLNITPSGNFLSGVHGFVSWCNDRKVPVSETATQYIKILKKYDSYKKGDFIDGMYKLKKTFKEVFLDEIFYIDFYAIEIFGKTKSLCQTKSEY